MIDSEETKEVVNSKILDEVLNSNLGENEKRFVLYYLESFNITQSYLKAFGGDKKHASVYGFSVFHKPAVQSQIKKLKKLMQIGYDIDPSRYIEFLLKSANADIGDYIKFSEEEVVQYDKNGEILLDLDSGKPLTKKINKMHLVDSDKIDTSIITSIKQGSDGISINLVDKLKCWEKIKEFFEWKKIQDETTIAETNIIEALKGSAERTWGEDDVYEDLDEALKEDR